MNKLKSVLLFSGFFITSIILAQEKAIDGVVAVVGNNIIMQSEIESQYLQYTAQSETVSDKTKCKVFEELLYQKLLLTQAQRDSVEVSEAQVDSELERRLRYFIAQLGSEEKFVEYYGKSVDAFKLDLRDNIKELLLAQTMQGKITNNIKITPADVRAYFEKIPIDSLPLINAEIEIGQIVKNPFVSDAAKMEAREKIEGLRKRVLKGEDFASLAVLYSEDPGSSKNGGKYEGIQRGAFVPEFDAISFKLKNGEISEVFETSYGFHFMQLIERRGEIVDLRHILISPKVSSPDMLKAKNILDSIYTLLLRDSISFTDAAARYSDDLDSKNNGGLIINPGSGTSKFQMDELGQLDPTLIFSVDKMKVGDFTQPMLMTTKDSKQAYRIILLKSRTEPHRANLKDDYQKIQSVALAEKQKKAVDEWIKKKVGSTYVKITGEYKSCSFDNKWVN